MRALNTIFIITTAVVLFSCAVNAPETGETFMTPAVIPEPVQMQMKEGSFELKPSTAIVYTEGDTAALAAAEMLKKEVSALMKTTLQTKTGKGSQAIVFEFDSAIAQPEGYRLNIGPDQMSIKASTGVGYFYAIQTLRQVWETSGHWEQDGIRLPQLEINDYPRFAWRGMMLDVSRHFFPKDFIKKYIDYLAMNKLNTFHWHLADDQGWRIQIRKYPLLTEKGAWRVNKEEMPWNARPPQQEGEKADFGGFYTQDDIREVVKYASERHVTVVPEIEMPAHVSAAIASYPWLSCQQKPITVPSGGVWPITDIYCAGNDSTFMFLEDVLTEVMELFPSKYIHIGGDEATKTEWEHCSKCRARMKAEGITDVQELQSYFIRRIEKFLNAHGRNLIGWDEILEGGLAPNAAVMSWRGMSGGVEAAKTGHKAVMCPGSHLYFDHYQGDQQLEPLAIGGFSPISHVYAFDPAPDSLGEAAKYIMGGQANLWTEYVPTSEHAEYMTFPRIYALAELLWSPRQNKNWEHFLKKVNRHLPLLEQRHINYARSMNNVTVTPAFNESDSTIMLRMAAENTEGEIHYTIDGTDPDASSPLYKAPLNPENTLTVKAGLFKEGKLLGKISSTDIFIHKAFAKKPRYSSLPAEKYKGSSAFVLTDGIRGGLNFGSGQWQGFNGKDMEILLTFEKPVVVKQVSAGFLQDYGSWIFRPNTVEVYISDDGVTFKKMAEQPADLPATVPEKQRVDFKVRFPERSTKYLKVVARNIGNCPTGHPGEGQPAWLFADEVMVE